jgi:prolyl-tRNA editing enzyme YbaK/EbsC (Cys-tRNA(Pro) deacylase)
MSTPVFQQICQFLDERAVGYRVVHHEPTFTSEESALARGEDLRIGAKALLIKTDEVFRLFVVSAARKVDSRAIRAALNVRKTRFATREELLELTGLEPGSVPPFGRPLLPFELYADPSVFENEKVAFNAGSLTDSIVMSAADYRRIAQPILLPFGTEETG